MGKNPTNNKNNRPDGIRKKDKKPKTKKQKKAAGKK